MIAYRRGFPGVSSARIFELPGRRRAVASSRLSPRLENAWVEAYHAEDAASRRRRARRARAPIVCPERGSPFTQPRGSCGFATPAASVWASAQVRQRPAAPTEGTGEDALITRPDCDVRVRVLPPLGYDFALRMREGATLVEAAHGARRPGVRLRDPSGRIGRVRRRRLHHPRTAIMIADTAHAPALAPLNAIGRLTGARLRARSGMAAAARSAARAGAARSLPRGSRAGTAGSRYPSERRSCFRRNTSFTSSAPRSRFRLPELVATMASTAEIVLPILLAFGPPHPLGGARPFVHDRNHPAHLPGRLGELPSLLGGDGARDPHLWPWRGFARPADWPRRLERKAQD